MTATWNTMRTILTIVALAVAFAPMEAQEWRRVDGIDSAAVYAITARNTDLFAVTASALFRSGDGGATWQATPGQPATTAQLTALAPVGSALYLGTRGDGVFRSTDDGLSWSPLSSGLTGSARSVVAFTVLGDSLYAGTDGAGIRVLDMSSGGGWSAFNSGLFQMGVVSLNTSGNTLVAGAGYYLFTRGRGAAQWSEVGLDDPGTQRLVFDTVVMGDRLFAGTDNGIYRGTLEARNWERVDIAAFPGRDIVALAVHGSRVMAAPLFLGQYWIFSSDNGGLDWDIRAHEFADLIDLLAMNGRLWAARFDGLWYIDIDAWTGVGEPADAPRRLPATLTLSPAFPNPFNPVTTLEFDVGHGGWTTLIVYDVLGRNVRTLLDGPVSGGRHRLLWDGRDDGGEPVASGTYLFRVRSGGQARTGRMVLQR